MIRHFFLVGALLAALFGILDRDAVFAALMGGSFGFQLALFLVDRSSQKELQRRRASASPVED